MMSAVSLCVSMSCSSVSSSQGPHYDYRFNYRHSLCCTVLCCTVLSCTVLYCLQVQPQLGGRRAVPLLQVCQHGVPWQGEGGRVHPRHQMWVPLYCTVSVLFCTVILQDQILSGHQMWVTLAIDYWATWASIIIFWFLSFPHHIIHIELIRWALTQTL